MRISGLELVCCGVLMVGLAVGRVWAETVSAGEVRLTVNEAGLVTGVQVGTADVFAGARAAPLVSLCDVTRGDTFVAGVPTGGSLAAGLELGFEGAQATATVRAEAFGEALKLTCDLRGAEGLAARGILLRFAFPMNCDGWRWHDDMQTSREIGAGEVFENVRALRAWADLPEWRDQPDLRMGYSNRNFCTVLTGPVGVCLAVPLDGPCVFRTAYDSGAKQLQMIYDFALSPDTGEPNAVAFSFVLYPCDPTWGFRSALVRFYRLYPEMFEVFVKEFGQWMAFSRLSEIDNANEFYFGLQEGAPEPEYDDKIAVLSCPYLTHAGMFANIPGHDPENDPLPEHDVLIEAMEAQFKRRTGMDNVYHEVGLYDAEGKLDIKQARVYGHIIAQFNLDLALPYGKWQLDRAVERTESTRERTGGELDGFYYDGLTGGLNYRAEQFQYSVAPPLWDPVAEKPLLNNFLSSCEFARAAAELLRPRGQVTMMNGALGASMFVAPWLDVLGSETGLRINREGLNYIRSVTHHKPFLTLLKGNYEQSVGRPEMELFMKRALAYGIFPGFFDWPPSGLGPGGRYWDHPEYYERDRDLFRRYEPLCKTLAVAGWEPVTLARSSNAQVFVERFGPAQDGIVWLTLLNEDSEAHETTLTLDAGGLGIDPAAAKCTELLTNKAVDFETQGGVPSAEIEVAADGVAMLQLCTPQQAAAWRLDQALETVERGITMRQVDAGKPRVAVHWHPGGAGYLREQLPNGPSMVFDGTDRGAQNAWQWAMLFQPEPAPVKLRVHAAGENLEGEGALRIYCRYAWVTRSYSHYETANFDLPKGSYDYKDFELDIECEQPLRAIYLRPEMAEGIGGKLKIASISLEDRFADDYVVDPDFEEWYEPVPEQMGDRLAGESAGVRDELARARQAVLRDLTSPATRDALLEAGGRCTKLRGWIVAEQAENGCRRVVRDLETAEQHLGVALLASLGVAAPEIVGPARAAPGDEVFLKFAVPAALGLPVRLGLVAAGVEQVRTTEQGTMLRISADAEPGTKLTIFGKALIGPEGRSAGVVTAHEIEVVPPLEVTLVSEGVDSDTAAFQLRAQVRNNRVRPVEAEVKVSVPEGWRAEGARALELPASGEADLDLRITPTEEAIPGSVEVAAAAIAGEDRAQASTLLLYIPAEANLLRNPGFEEGAAAWGGLSETTVIDTDAFRNGAASLRMYNARQANRSQVSQTVTLNQEQPCAILVRAASRGENVSGSRDRGYSLYVDIYYTDGTPLYGQTYDFATGTSDWQLGELCIEPAKPIRNVNVYLLLRDKSGTVWFDDVAVMEDPRRKGNMGRDAEATVDSAYSGYGAEPVNDGIIYPAEDAHWTDEAWASAEEQRDHFIELRFAEPREVGRVAIYWSLDAGIPRTSAEVQVRVPEGEGWRTVATATPAEPVPVTVIRLEAPVTAQTFRILQPNGKGPAGRPNLMWVREVELFPPQ